MPPTLMKPVSRELQREMQKFFPLIVAWATELEKQALQHGEPLCPEFRRAAEILDIRDINAIRVWRIEEMPNPQDHRIAELAERFGLSIKKSAGISMGRGILVRETNVHDGSVMAHELVHARQYEQAGGIAAFLIRYMNELARFGYAAMPMETEAQLGAIAVFASSVFVSR